ncbi:MAG: sulfotransferase domain-containing protein [Hahellaceae bacterium]|nr:sulfotransferase domain-containing protein [Hahellaceae bacterium]
MKPTFIGIGAQKCASSWIYRVFSDHPEAFVSTPKELDFFSFNYEKGFEWYEKHFNASIDQKAIGEISPSYFPDTDAPARAARYNPELKIIVNLRDPIERAYSNHLHEVRLGNLTGADLSFERGLKNNPMYTNQGLYAEHLSRWMQFFPRENFLVIFQEDVKTSAEHETRHLYDFLGINRDHRSEFTDQKANESYLPKSQNREDRFKSVGKTLNRIGMGAVARSLRKSSFYQNIKSQNRLNIREIVPPMRPETRKELELLFAQDSQALAKLINRNALPWENRQSTHHDGTDTRG